VEEDISFDPGDIRLFRMPRRGLEAGGVTHMVEPCLETLGHRLS
jgi:hypothetical protein